MYPDTLSWIPLVGYSRQINYTCNALAILSSTDSSILGSCVSKVASQSYDTMVDMYVDIGIRSKRSFKSVLHNSSLNLSQIKCAEAPYCVFM